jgi:hypothetical protein
MNPKVISMIVLFAVAVAHHARGSEKQRGSMLRDDLHRMILSDGAWLVISTPFPSNEQREERLPVEVSLYPRDVQYVKQIDKCFWVAKNVTLMDYVPGNERYYALAKESKDRVFIFFTWNSQHCTIDRQTGRILRKNEGDEALKLFDNLVPLKLLIWRRASYRPARPTNNSDLFGPIID